MDIRQAGFSQAFIYSKKRRNLGALREAVSQSAATLLHSYLEEGIPSNTCPPWSRLALDKAIKNGTHLSAYTLGMIIFIRGELQRQVQDVFSILLSTEYAVRVFGDNIKLSHIAAVP